MVLQSRIPFPFKYDESSTYSPPEKSQNNFDEPESAETAESRSFDLTEENSPPENADQENLDGLETHEEEENEEEPPHLGKDNLENQGEEETWAHANSDDSHSSHSELVVEDDSNASELNESDEEDPTGKGTEEDLTSNLLTQSTTSSSTPSLTQSSTPHLRPSRSASFSSPSVIEKVALFNRLAESSKRDKETTLNSDTSNLAELLGDLREQIVARIEESNKVNFKEYNYKLEQNLKVTEDNKNRIVNLEKKVSNLTTHNETKNLEIEKLKAVHSDLEAKVER